MKKIPTKTSQRRSGHYIRIALVHLFKEMKTIASTLSNKAGPWLKKRSKDLVEYLTRFDGEAHWSSLTPSQHWNRLIIWTLVGVSSFGIVWSLFARIDETVTSTGKLEPQGSTVDVKAPLGGVIKEVLVRDGEMVQKGQVLVEMDTTAARARLLALKKVREATLVDLKISRSQLGEEIDLEGLNRNQVMKMYALRDEYISRINASKELLSQSRNQLAAKMETLTAMKKSLEIRERILAKIKPLASVGGISQSQYLKELNEVEILRGEVKSLYHQIDMAQAQVRESRQKLVNTQELTRIDFTTKVEEAEKQLAQLDNQINEARVTLRYQELRSPKTGLVFDLQATSSGYVANNERPVLKIVPTDNLIAKIFIANSDIGFIKNGQSVRVRVDAYPYNEFGDISGTIKSIGSDVLEPDEKANYYRFPVTVKLSNQFIARKGRNLPLTAGMSVNANIRIRERPVIAIFTEKILPFWNNLEKL